MIWSKESKSVFTTDDMTVSLKVVIFIYQHTAQDWGERTCNWIYIVNCQSRKICDNCVLGGDAIVSSFDQNASSLF